MSEWDFIVKLSVADGICMAKNLAVSRIRSINHSSEVTWNHTIFQTLPNAKEERIFGWFLWSWENRYGYKGCNYGNNTAIKISNKAVIYTLKFCNGIKYCISLSHHKMVNMLNIMVFAKHVQSIDTTQWSLLINSY